MLTYSNIKTETLQTPAPQALQQAEVVNVDSNPKSELKSRPSTLNPNPKSELNQKSPCRTPKEAVSIGAKALVKTS